MCNDGALYYAYIIVGTEGYARKIEGPIITLQIIMHVIYKLYKTHNKMAELATQNETK